MRRLNICFLHLILMGSDICALFFISTLAQMIRFSSFKKLSNMKLSKCTGSNWAAIIVGCEPLKEITKQLMNAQVNGRAALDIHSFVVFGGLR